MTQHAVGAGGVVFLISGCIATSIGRRCMPVSGLRNWIRFRADRDWGWFTIERLGFGLGSTEIGVWFRVGSWDRGWIRFKGLGLVQGSGLRDWGQKPPVPHVPPTNDAVLGDVCHSDSVRLGVGVSRPRQKAPVLGLAHTDAKHAAEQRNHDTTHGGGEKKEKKRKRKRKRTKKTARHGTRSQRLQRELGVPRGCVR